MDFNVVYKVFWMVTFPASSLYDIMVLYITQVPPSMVFAHQAKIISLIASKSNSTPLLNKPHIL